MCGREPRVESNSHLSVQVLELVSPEQEFAQLRGRFHQRLQREEIRLTLLSEALGGAKGTSALVVEDIGIFAHRLRGAAMVFEYRRIGDAAKAVELAAATVTLDEDGTRDERLVVSTTQVLAMRLAEQTGSAMRSARDEWPGDTGGE
jgi:hypothetical protein